MQSSILGAAHRSVAAILAVLAAFAATSATWPLLQPTPMALFYAAVLAGAIVATFNGDTRQSAGDALTFTPLTTDPGYEGMPAWSPDGQTIAYVADVNSTLQVFTRQRSASVSAQITQAPYDCRHPLWSPDQKELFFDVGGHLFAVPINAETSLSAGKSVAVPITGYIQGPLRRQYDMLPDGKRFLMMYWRRSGP